MATDTLVRPLYGRFSWSSIFAGTFVFLAIEVTFGVLGAAIFASATNPASANPIGTGIATGLGIWMIILSIIALHFAGRVAGGMSGTIDRSVGMWHGLVTFGMCIFTTALVVSMSVISAASATPTATPGEGYIVHTLVTGGWWLFFTLVLSMIAAGTGGAHAVNPRGITDTGIAERDPRVRNIA
ncbi:MAG: hypothetical protein ABI383_01730 [Acidobacteriaceae bacterium]